jgi:hypothetical protein
VEVLHLTAWHQKRKLQSFALIYEAFLDNPEEPPSKQRLERRTWAGLKQKIPESTLSRNLRELIKEGYIKVTRAVDEKDGKLKTFYEWNNEKGLVFEFKDCDKLKFARFSKNGKTYIGWLYVVNPRFRKRSYLRFVKVTEV